MSITQVKILSFFNDVKEDDEKHQKFNTSSWFTNFKHWYDMNSTTLKCGRKLPLLMWKLPRPILLQWRLLRWVVTLLSRFSIYIKLVYIGKKLLSRTYISVKESAALGYKVSKDCLFLIEIYLKLKMFLS